MDNITATKLDGQDSIGTMDAQSTWEKLSGWWDEAIGEGDTFHQHLIYPFIESSLSLQAGDRLLDLACGNGCLGRRFAANGVLVTGVDFSSTFLEIARRKSERMEGVNYLLLDLTCPDHLAQLPETSFHAVVCSMALHNMHTIEPLVRAVARVIKPGGRFVCSTLHPYFNSTPSMSILKEEDFSQPLIEATHSIRIFDYLQPAAFLARGKQDQPMPHHNFHRPLQSLLQTFFAAGFVMDGYFEPSADLMPTEVQSRWKSLPGISPVLIISFRMH